MTSSSVRSRADASSSHSPIARPRRLSGIARAGPRTTTTRPRIDGRSNTPTTASPDQVATARPAPAPEAGGERARPDLIMSVTEQGHMHPVHRYTRTNTCAMSVHLRMCVIAAVMVDPAPVDTRATVTACIQSRGSEIIMKWRWTAI